MSADPFMGRVQRRVLDDAGHPDVSVERFRIADEWDDLDWATIGAWSPYPQPSPIFDQLLLESLAASSPRPSLWQRTVPARRRGHFMFRAVLGVGALLIGLLDLNAGHPWSAAAALVPAAACLALTAVAIRTGRVW